MKVFLFYLLAITSFSNCQEKDIQLHYLAQTRGFFLQIDVSENFITVINQRGGLPFKRKLTQSELQELQKILSEINFEKVEKSKDSKSTYDAAPYATLVYQTKTKSYSYDFDHGYPPKTLKDLVNKFLTLSEIVE